MPQVLLHCSLITVEYGDTLQNGDICAQLARLSMHDDDPPAVVAKFRILTSPLIEE